MSRPGMSLGSCWSSPDDGHDVIFIRDCVVDVGADGGADSEAGGVVDDCMPAA